MSGSSEDDSQYEVRVDKHLFRWEPPDIGLVRYCGDLDGPTTGLISEKSRRITLGKPRIFLLVDMTKLGKVTAEARQLSAQGSKDLNLRGVAVVGASAPLRLIAGLVSRAIDLVNGNTDNPTRFFETESQARQWIATRRATLVKTEPADG